MNTCSYCGKPIQAGMARCQFCGKPVTSAASSGGSGGSGGSTKAVTPGQAELPAWLETLRAGNQSTPSSTGVGGASDLSPDDFADESQLPGWMQSDRNDAVDNSPSGAYPARRPASMSAPNTDNAFIPTKGMSASSFIDEQFLPSWLQEKQIATSNAPQENIGAASLVQQDALPDWIKAVPPQPTPPVTQPVTLYGQQVTPANPTSPMPPTTSVRPPQAIAGNDLIDLQAVPQWMAGQNASVPPNGQTGFSASSLVDKEMLPPWMRQSGQEQHGGNAHVFHPTQSEQPSYGQPANYQLPFGQVQGQQPQQPSMPQGAIHDQMQAPPPQQQQLNVQQAASANQSLSASSFIDVNALPEWLRSPDNVRAGATPPPSPIQQGGADQQRQGTFGIPPRPEYVRVPSRPRSDPGSYEDSAVAANAFASMLGVASATPFFPGQQSRDALQGQKQGQVPTQAQQPQNMPVAPTGNGARTFSPNTSSISWGAPGASIPPGISTQSQVYTGQTAQQPGQGLASVPPATGYQNGYAMNTMPGTVPPQSQPIQGAGMQQSTQVNSNGGQSKTQAKPAKRGFLSTILDWFSR